MNDMYRDQGDKHTKKKELKFKKKMAADHSALDFAALLGNCAKK